MTEKFVEKLANGNERKINYVGNTLYMLNGMPISAAEFLEYLFGDLGGLVADGGELEAIWSNPDCHKGFCSGLTKWVTIASDCPIYAA